jgi:serralysin
LAPKSRVDGGAGNDVIDAGLVAFPLLLRVNDALYRPGGLYLGGDGADTITGTNASDVIAGGNQWYGEALPFDPAFPSRAAQLRDGADLIDARGGDDSVQGNFGNDSILGGEGDDTLRGETGDDFLNGGDNEDNLDGGVGNDTIFSGNGNDIVFGGDGNDLIVDGDNVATSFVLEGAHTISPQPVVFSHGSRVDTLMGGRGNDTLDGGPR